MFELKAIQAYHGDALLISFGEDIIRHILVDGGPARSLDNLLSVLEDIKTNGILRLDLLVVSHYDLDHIGGIIALLKAKPSWLSIGDIWFNGRYHSQPADALGTRESDELSKLITQQRLPWNLAFKGECVVTGKYPWINLAGGLNIKVVSPSAEELQAVGRKWARDHDSLDNLNAPGDCLGRRDMWPAPPFANVKRGPFQQDTSPANGSSIGLLLEYRNSKVLLAADAFPHVIVEALGTLDEQPVELALLKLAHHGSQGNTSAKLLDTIDCREFVISTDGSIHCHPDQSLIARILDHVTNPSLIFNYDNLHTGHWRDPPKNWPKYKCQYPRWNEVFVRVPIPPKK